MLCDLGMTDCMFNTGTGDCVAEWCIFKELPAIEVSSRKITCDVCNESTITVSTYSGKSDYVCRDCKKKINKVIKDPKCVFCGTKTEPGESICSDCTSQIKDSKCIICGTKTELGKSLCNTCANKLSATCPICGISTGLGNSICGSCATAIRGKLNE